MADPDISLSIIRPDDLLVLTVEGVNLTRGTGPSGPALVRIDPAAEMYLVAEFPPQAFAERAYLEDEAGGGEPPEAPPVPARASVPTRLAFRVPPGTDVPFTVEGLLAWDRLEPVLVAAASGPSPAQPAPPLVAPTGSTSLAELPRQGHRRPGSCCRTGSCCRRTGRGAGRRRRGPGRARAAGSSCGTPGWARRRLRRTAGSTRPPDHRCARSGRRTTRRPGGRCLTARRRTRGVGPACAPTGDTRSSG